MSFGTDRHNNSYKYKLIVTPSIDFIRLHLNRQSSTCFWHSWPQTPIDTWCIEFQEIDKYTFDLVHLLRISRHFLSIHKANMQTFSFSFKSKTTKAPPPHFIENHWPFSWVKRTERASSLSRSGTMWLSSRPMSRSGSFSVTSSSTADCCSRKRDTSNGARTSAPKSFSGSLWNVPKTSWTLWPTLAVEPFSSRSFALPPSMVRRLATHTHNWIDQKLVPDKVTVQSRDSSFRLKGETSANRNSSARQTKSPWPRP